MSKIKFKEQQKHKKTLKDFIEEEIEENKKKKNETYNKKQKRG